MKVWAVLRIPVPIKARSARLPVRILCADSGYYNITSQHAPHRVARPSVITTLHMIRQGFISDGGKVRFNKIKGLLSMESWAAAKKALS